MAGDRVITAMTVLCEADSESDVCKAWIVWTIYNRVKSGRWEKTMAGVCLQRMQYSEWNADRGDNANLERVANLSENDPNWHGALALVDAVMEDIASGVPDPTNGATHFFANTISPPAWAAAPATLTGQQGKVLFYSNVP